MVPTCKIDLKQSVSLIIIIDSMTIDIRSLLPNTIQLHLWLLKMTSFIWFHIAQIIVIAFSWDYEDLL